MTENNILSDYSPLYLDLPGNPPHTVSGDASDLVLQSFGHNHTPFQAMVLLVKNAFEGHVYLTRERTPDKLMENGTFLVDLKQEASFSLVYDFFELVDLYTPGLRTGWEKVVDTYQVEGPVCFDSMLRFILANQLFKFPVSVLDAYSVPGFTEPTESQARYFLNQFLVGKAMTRFLGEYRLIRTVNARYDHLFRETVIKIRSREEVLSQVQTKLLMANDPAIKTEQDLERTYFNFMVATRMKNDEERHAFRGAEFHSSSGGKVSQEFLLSLLRQLYRTISKNCREAHTAMTGESGPGALKDLFIEASDIYNEVKQDECDYFIHYYRLLEVLGQALLFRRERGLPVSYSDFTGLQGRLPLPKISREFIEEIKGQLADRAIRTRSQDQVGFKLKNVCDEELALIHREYLERQIEFLDGCIRDVLDRIRACMADKNKNSEVHSCIT